ncbi:MAG TPA: NUDIX hydrolase [Pyrinomonadaceae bacterium]|nr:NUDIX hydrolase [Pyrinomonadaceae bacterium]
MIKKAIGAVWKKLPLNVRQKIVRTSQRKFTVSAAAILINEGGEVLLLDHVLRPKFGWGLPGGFVDPNEQPIEAARREVREETGLEVEGLTLFRVRTVGRHIEILFKGKPVGEARVLTREIYGLGWFRREDLPKGMTPQLRGLLLEVLNADV